MQQAITWAIVDPDLCHQILSPGHNELSNIARDILYSHKMFYSDINWNIMYFV